MNSLQRKVIKLCLQQQIRFLPYSQMLQQYYHDLPFVRLYKDVTGATIPDNFISNLKNKYPKIIKLSQDQLKDTLQVLNKFGIQPEDACTNPHVFCMNFISMENYGEILKECNFTMIRPIHIIRYHTLVKSRTIKQLKEQGLLKTELKLEELLCSHFQDWERENINLINFSDSDTNILTIRLSVLERYLQWKFSISSEQFQKYCRNYLPIKHRPMCDIKEALNIALNDIKFDVDTIRRNGFIISSDPVNTKLILENVNYLGGLDIRDAIKIEPAILKNHYQALLDIRDLLEQYNISKDAQRKCLKVFCMVPKTVQQRLEQLTNQKEYQVLSTNPRVLYMVVHERKMMNRLARIQAAKKQCFSLNRLVSSSKIFNIYINSFGSKVCSKDIAALISSSLRVESITNKTVLQKLKRHKYWLHTALNAIDENIQMLKKEFSDEVIIDNCQILLYPGFELEQYIDFLLKIRDGKIKGSSNIEMDAAFKNVNYRLLTNNQILSLVLYEIEKKYYFSGDGVWNKLEGGKNQKVKQTMSNY